MTKKPHPAILSAYEEIAKNVQMATQGILETIEFTSPFSSSELDAIAKSAIHSMNADFSVDLAINSTNVFQTSHLWWTPQDEASLLKSLMATLPPSVDFEKLARSAKRLREEMLQSKTMIFEFMPAWIDVDEIKAIEHDELIIRRSFLKNRKVALSKAHLVLSKLPPDDSHYLAFKQAIMAFERGLYAPSQAVFANILESCKGYRLLEEHKPKNSLSVRAKALTKGKFSVDAFNDLTDSINSAFDTDLDRWSYLVLVWTELTPKDLLKRYSSNSAPNRNLIAHQGGASYSKFNALFFMVIAILLLEGCYEENSKLFLPASTWAV